MDGISSERTGAQRRAGDTPYPAKKDAMYKQDRQQKVFN